MTCSIVGQNTNFCSVVDVANSHVLMVFEHWEVEILNRSAKFLLSKPMLSFIKVIRNSPSKVNVLKQTSISYWNAVV